MAIYVTGIAIISITQNMGNIPINALVDPARVRLRSPVTPEAVMIVTCACMAGVMANPTRARTRTLSRLLMFLFSDMTPYILVGYVYLSQTAIYATGIAIISITQNMGNSVMIAFADPVRLPAPDVPEAIRLVTWA